MGLCALGPAEGVSGGQELICVPFDAHRCGEANGAEIVVFGGVLAELWVFEQVGVERKKSCREGMGW
jgi:hypothetical protein